MRGKWRGACFVLVAMSLDLRAVPVLVVDDDSDFTHIVTRYLRGLGCDVHVAASAAEARAILHRRSFPIALVDYKLGDGTGSELVAWALPGRRIGAAYLVSSPVRCDAVAGALRAGFTDALAKPLELSRLDAIVEQQRQRDGDMIASWRERHAPELIAEDPQSREVLRLVREIAPIHCTVLVTGESGTGKEEIARAIHNASSRSEKPFVAVNCAAIPPSLIEAELFGHARGAFTGAVGTRDGLIASADGGTLFLDEIGDMPAEAQAKLLRVLQNRSLTPVGSDRSVTVDVRVVAATNKDLEAMVEAGTFREDLYYRLCVIPVELPPLRERPGDILPLARFFASRAAERHGRRFVGFEPAAERALLEHAWPGNVRQLANVIERAVVLRGDALIQAADLRLGRRERKSGPMPVAALAPEPVPAPAPATSSGEQSTLNLREALESVERSLIERALKSANGNRTEAAALLGLNRSTLVEKIRKFAY
jgi:DNA-binding NtrC family response regulator